jgi:hypothetical protein
MVHTVDHSQQEMQRFHRRRGWLRDGYEWIGALLRRFGCAGFGLRKSDGLQDIVLCRLGLRI